jgi:nickel-type superoxide dismutase maturation protease
MLRVFKVTGDSLYPAFRQGDFVLISKIPFWFNRLRVGEAVVFNHPVYGQMIKQIERILDGGRAVFVVGLDEFSVDSRQFGPVARADLLGKVIWHIRQTAK